MNKEKLRSALAISLTVLAESVGSSSRMEVESRLRDRREEMNGCTLSGKKSFGAEARKGNVRTN
jgi:hypothetical protein